MFIILEQLKKDEPSKIVTTINCQRIKDIIDRPKQAQSLSAKLVSAYTYGDQKKTL